MTARPTPPPRIGIVTGLVAEADCLLKPRTRPAPRVLVSGGVPARTGELAQALIAEGATGLVSFGVAGGLDPALGVGAILLPREVLTSDGARFATHPEWRSALSAAIGEDATDTTMLGCDRFVGTVMEKRALFRETAAAAVDMESHVIAAAAAAAGLPFIVLRAITDPGRARTADHRRSGPGPRRPDPPIRGCPCAYAAAGRTARGDTPGSGARPGATRPSPRSPTRPPPDRPWRVAPRRSGSRCHCAATRPDARHRAGFRGRTGRRSALPCAIHRGRARGGRSVWLTAVASKPQCTMQFAHFS